MGRLAISILIVVPFLSCGSALSFWTVPSCDARPNVLKCPKNYANAKCYCKFNQNSCQSSIECKDISDTTELQEAFQFKWGSTKDFDYIRMENSMLTSLPDGIFNGVSFKEFYFWNATLHNVGDKAFQESEKSATEINIYDCEASGFNFKSLENLKKLTTVFIGKSNIKDVPQGVFSKLALLETIYLRDNKIEQILPDTFNLLPNLRYLDVAGNKLTEIKNGALNLAAVKEKKRGVSVDLENNQITTIESKVFAGIATPGYIDIQDNKLTDVPEEVFKPLLETMKKQNAGTPDVWVNVRENPVDCTKNIDWILKDKEFRDKVGGYKCPDGTRPIIDYKKP